MQHWQPPGAAPVTEAKLDELLDREAMAAWNAVEAKLLPLAASTTALAAGKVPTTEAAPVPPPPVTAQPPPNGTAPLGWAPVERTPPLPPMHLATPPLPRPPASMARTSATVSTSMVATQEMAAAAAAAAAAVRVTPRPKPAVPPQVEAQAALGAQPLQQPPMPPHVSFMPTAAPAAGPEGVSTSGTSRTTSQVPQPEPRRPPLPLPPGTKLSEPCRGGPSHDAPLVRPVASQTSLIATPDARPQRAKEAREAAMENSTRMPAQQFLPPSTGAHSQQRPSALRRPRSRSPRRRDAHHGSSDGCARASRGGDGGSATAHRGNVAVAPAVNPPATTSQSGNRRPQLVAEWDPYMM